MDLENKEDPNAKEKSKDENISQLVEKTIVSLEGTHTTSTDTDNLNTINSRLSFPETSERLRNELKEINIKPIIIGYDNDNCPQKSDLAKRPVGEMLEEMNGNIQAILDLFAEHYMEKEMGRVRGEEIEYFKEQITEKENLKSLAEIENVDSAANENEVVIDIEPMSTAVILAETHNSILKSVKDQEAGILEPSSTKVSETNCHTVVIPLESCNNSFVGSTSQAPCESTHHTLHIHAASSPTSSVMFRAPMCVRLWTIITDFFSAICLCLQVNKDCIFCLGFFIAFVVSASFLTAFFYRTLSLDPQSYRNQKYKHQMEGQPSKGIARKSNYNY